MTKKRIKKLADFFYSSNSSTKVPLRIAITTGMTGNDLTKQQFIELITILSNSVNIKDDLREFVNSIYNG